MMNERLTKRPLTTPQKMANSDVPMTKSGATPVPKYASGATGVGSVAKLVIPLVLYVVFKCGSCNFIND